MKPNPAVSVLNVSNADWARLAVLTFGAVEELDYSASSGPHSRNSGVWVMLLATIERSLSKLTRQIVEGALVVLARGLMKMRG